MKYSMSVKVYGKVYLGMIKKSLTKDVKNKIKQEYKNIMLRAKDIGDKNNLLGSYTLAAIFIALNRSNNLNVEENYKLLENGMKKSKILKIAMGDGKNYCSPKRNEFRRKWSEETHKHKYENDWVVDIAVDDGKTYGLDYTECGVCKLCKDEGCFEYAKYLCKLDFLLANIMGLTLTRTTTLADDGPKCDFRYENPSNKK